MWLCLPGEGISQLGQHPILWYLIQAGLFSACVGFKEAVQASFPILLLTGEEDCPPETMFCE